MIKRLFHQVLLHVAGSAVPLGLSPCIGATGLAVLCWWRCITVQEPVKRRQKLFGVR